MLLSPTKLLAGMRANTQVSAMQNLKPGGHSKTLADWKEQMSNQFTCSPEDAKNIQDLK